MVLHVEEIFEGSRVMVRHAVDHGQRQLLLLASPTQKESEEVLGRQRQEARVLEKKFRTEGRLDWILRAPVSWYHCEIIKS